jgi:microsomal epoxide hydrolase
MTTFNGQGSFLEFVQVAKILKGSRYALVIPSLPGYVFSDAFPVDRDRGMIDVAKVMNNLMLGLGYNEYAIQVSTRAE